MSEGAEELEGQSAEQQDALASRYVISWGRKYWQVTDTTGPAVIWIDLAHVRYIRYYPGEPDKGESRMHEPHFSLVYGSGDEDALTFNGRKATEAIALWNAFIEEGFYVL